MKNKVFIATSIDGFIADQNGNIDWLHSVPNPDNIDMGYNDFMTGIDAILMGRNTFETLCSFDIEWPYKKPVFVLSNNLKQVPENLKNKVEIVKGNPKEVVSEINKKGFANLYIDGGKTIQGFLQHDLIDELIITIIPVILGAGIPLFQNNSKQINKLNFECVKSKVFLGKVVQNCFVRKQIKT